MVPDYLVNDEVEEGLREFRIKSRFLGHEAKPGYLASFPFRVAGR